jgi:molybdate transport system substrate-binding protein
MPAPGISARFGHWRIRLVLLFAILAGGFGAVLVTPSALAQIACDTTESGRATSASQATPVTTTETVPFPDDGGELTVFAAASLVDAFGVIETDLEGQYPGLDIVLETAGSQTLVTQLTEGADADVLATANASTMTDAIDAGLINGEPVVFTGNRLVIVAPEDNPAGITTLDDLAGDDLHLVVAGADVPVGAYSRNVLCAYGASGDASDGFLEAVTNNIVSEEVDVRSVLAKVQLGEADAGLVYASDAVASELAGTPLTVIEFPDALNASAAYPIAPVAGGNTELARAFISYVLGDAGQATLNAYGFAIPGN